MDFKSDLISSVSYNHCWHPSISVIDLSAPLMFVIDLSASFDLCYWHCQHTMVFVIAVPALVIMIISFSIKFKIWKYFQQQVCNINNVNVIMKLVTHQQWCYLNATMLLEYQTICSVIAPALFCVVYWGERDCNDAVIGSVIKLLSAGDCLYLVSWEQVSQR